MDSTCCWAGDNMNCSDGCCSHLACTQRTTTTSQKVTCVSFWRACVNLIWKCTQKKHYKQCSGTMEYTLGVKFKTNSSPVLVGYSVESTAVMANLSYHSVYVQSRKVLRSHDYICLYKSAYPFSSKYKEIKGNYIFGATDKLVHSQHNTNTGQ